MDVGADAQGDRARVAEELRVKRKLLSARLGKRYDLFDRHRRELADLEPALDRFQNARYGRFNMTLAQFRDKVRDLEQQIAKQLHAEPKAKLERSKKLHENHLKGTIAAIDRIIASDDHLAMYGIASLEILQAEVALRQEALDGLTGDVEKLVAEVDALEREEERLRVWEAANPDEDADAWVFEKYELPEGEAAKHLHVETVAGPWYRYHTWRVEGRSLGYEKHERKVTSAQTTEYFKHWLFRYGISSPPEEIRTGGTFTVTVHGHATGSGCEGEDAAAFGISSGYSVGFAIEPPDHMLRLNSVEERSATGTYTIRVTGVLRGRGDRLELTFFLHGSPSGMAWVYKRKS